MVNIFNIFEIFKTRMWEEEIFWDTYLIPLETHFRLCIEWMSYQGFGCT